jgi:ketosteroid isomerase-like protein
VIERFEEAFDCWNRGEFDQMLEMYAEDAVFDVSKVFTDVEPIHGSENIRSYWATLRETWDGVRIDPLAGFDVGNDRVVIDQRMWAKGTRSGIGVDQRFAMLYEIRPADQKCVSAQLFPDVETAMAAAESGK